MKHAGGLTDFVGAADFETIGEQGKAKRPGPLADRDLSFASLAHALENSSDSVKLIDQDRTVLWMNAAGLSSLEVDDFQRLLGGDWASYWPKDTREEIRNLCESARLNGDAKLTAFCPTARGKPKWWDVTVTRVNNTQGEPKGFLVISRDVTETVQAKLAVEAGYDEMRHRLRNSFTLAACLIDGLAGEREHLRDFSTEIRERLMGLSDVLSLKMQSSDTAALVTIIRNLTDQFGNGRCRIACDCDESIIVGGKTADAVALVLGELAVNASKYGALKFDGQIDLSVEKKDEQLVIVWRETMPQSITRTSRPEGQGMKLMRRILAAQKGRIDIDWQTNGLTAKMKLIEPSS